MFILKILQTAWVSALCFESNVIYLQALAPFFSEEQGTAGIENGDLNGNELLAANQKRCQSAVGTSQLIHEQRDDPPDSSVSANDTFIFSGNMRLCFVLAPC